MGEFVRIRWAVERGDRQVRGNRATNWVRSFMARAF